jgi:glycosyltransferase involved in cell wall biosynthesis
MKGPGSKVRHVALFHPCLIHGGIPRVFADLARGFLQAGLAVDIVQATRESDFIGQLPSAARVIDLNARRALTSFVPLVRYLRQERPDVLISGAVQTNVVAAWARRAANVETRLVLTEHSMLSAVIESAARLSTSVRTRISPFFIRRFYPWADALVAVSQGAAEDLAAVTGIPLAKIHVIHNPVVSPELFMQAAEPLEHPWFGDGDPPVVLAVGRLDYFKDYPTLLRAFAKLRETTTARLLILGEGDQRGLLESMIRELNVEADVALPGNVANPLPFMKRAAVFALSSSTESFGNVLVEALAAGAAIVATDCRFGPREILAAGAYGTLVPVGDHDALARAINNALSEPHCVPPAEALTRFSREASVKAYLRLICQLSSND